MPSNGRGIAPRHRRRQASNRPASAEVQFPIGDFLIRPTDALGRHVTLNVQVAPQVRRAASKMTAKNEFGFETEQDAIRWAITYGMEELAKRSENHEITGDVALISSWNQLAKDELEKQWYLTAIERQEAVVYGLVEGGHITRALQHAERLWQDHDRIENPYWRAEYRTRAKRLLDYVRKMIARSTRPASSSPQRVRMR